MGTLNLSWKYLLFEGIVFILFGIFALANPLVTSLSLEWILGVLLTAGGIVQGYRALTSIKEKGSIYLLIGAAFTLVAGILLLTNPLAGIVSLSVLLTAYFFVDGISKIISSIYLRKIHGWFWLLLSGIISVILGGMIVSGWPTTALWILGVYVGIYMLMLGFSLATIAFALKKYPL